MGSIDKAALFTENEVPKPKTLWGVRHTYCIMAFLGSATGYFMRMNLSVTIVAMVNSTRRADDEELEKACIQHLDPDQDNDGSEGDFDWTAAEQGVILGSFFYGYILTQMLGGYLTEKFGGKWLVIGGLSLASAMNFVFPVVIKESVVAFMVLRAVQGMGEGFSFVGIYTMSSKWIPKPERGRLLTFTLAGGQVGIIVALPLCAFIADEFGWEMVFYVSGSLGAVVVLLWTVLVFSFPRTHPRISQDERLYIEANTAAARSGRALPNPPFKSIITCVPFLSMIVLQVGIGWGAYLLMTGIPTYLANIQHFDLKTNGLLSALPYICCWLSTFPFGFAMDQVVNRGWLPLPVARRIANTIGTFGPAAGLVWLSWVGCNQTMAIVVLCLILILNAGIYSGIMQNSVDLSPNYCGTLFGIANTVGNLSGFLSPLAMGAITNDNQTIEAWRMVFLICATVYVVTNTQNLFFGKFELQEWNTYWEVQDDTDTKQPKHRVHVTSMSSRRSSCMSVDWDNLAYQDSIKTQK